MTPPDRDALIARLRAIAAANVCDLYNMGDEAHEPPQITWGELNDIGLAAKEAADALAAPPPPADPPRTDTPQGLVCDKCGTTMVQRFSYRPINSLSEMAIPNGYFDCMKCGAVVVPPQENQ